MEEMMKPFVALCFERNALTQLSSVVGPCDEGGFKFYRLLMQHHHRSAGGSGDGGHAGSDNSADLAPQQRVVIPQTKDNYVFEAPSLKSLLKRLKKRYNNKGKRIDALLIVQTQPTESDNSINDPDFIADAKDFIASCKIELVTLAVGNSCEFADVCSDGDGCYVLGWMNKLVDQRQTDVAFKFCYTVLGLYLEHLSEIGTQERRSRATRSFLTTLDDFTRLMHGNSHVYSFGMKRDGEPCLFPDYPARPYVEWSIEMYETRLRNAALQCALALSKLEKDCHSDNLQLDEARRNEIMFRIGTYLGWFVLIRYNPTHNRLSRKKDFYGLEWSFSGALLTAAADEKFAKDYQELVYERQVKNVIKYLPHQSVDDGDFQFYKLEMIAMGEVMLTRTRSCVISRAMFFQYLDNGKSTGNERGPAQSVRKHFAKLSHELERMKTIFSNPADHPSKRSLQQRLIWIHNSFQAMHHGLLYPAAEDNFATGPSSNSSVPVSYALDAQAQRADHQSPEKDGGAPAWVWARVARDVFPYVAVAGLLLERSQESPPSSSAFASGAAITATAAAACAALAAVASVVDARLQRKPRPPPSPSRARFTSVIGK